MQRLQPVLQIIHVTDLHMTADSANPNHKLHVNRRFSARLAQKMIERFDLFGWNEGTQGHYRKAAVPFLRFLCDWRKDDQRWYGEPGGDSAQTWLVDTGDLTTFGDEESLTAGQNYLDDLRSVLGGCDYRTLYGNHDAWPETHPIHAITGHTWSEISAQRKKIAGRPEWNSDHWLTHPLSVKIPGTGAHIELFAFDTVYWGAAINTLALGSISTEDLETLRSRLRDQWNKSKTKNFRILALHHPLAFPYIYKESHSLYILPSRTLSRAKKWIRELRNDRDDPCGLGPLAHLFLSGHTHIAYPAGKLPDGIMGNQGLLSSAQLQLVGGALMLNKSERAANAAANSAPTRAKRKKPRYCVAAVDWNPCQAQILQFFADPNEHGQLIIVRTPVSSVDGSVYVGEGEESSMVVMTYDTH